MSKLEAYCSSTGKGGTPTPSSNNEISSLTISSARHIRLMRSFCESVSRFLICKSLLARRAGMEREACPVRICPLCESAALVDTRLKPGVDEERTSS